MWHQDWLDAAHLLAGKFVRPFAIILLTAPPIQRCCEASQVPAVCQRRESYSIITLVLESFIITDVRASRQCIGVSLSKGAQWGRYENKNLNISGCPPTPQPPPPWNIQTCSNVLCKRRVKKKEWKMGSGLDWFPVNLFFLFFEKIWAKSCLFFFKSNIVFYVFCFQRAWLGEAS